MIRAVIFDFDGTLADTRENILNAYRRVISEQGCVVSDDYVERKIGIGGRMVLKNIFDENKIPHNEDFIKKNLARIETLRIEAIDKIRIFSGTLPLLDGLYKKFKLALATMSTGNIIDLLLQKRGMKKYFDVVVTARDVTLAKPHPEIFLTCAKKMGKKPKQCVVVEDSIFGVEAAESAGMQCIAVTTGSYSSEELLDAGADLIVDSVENKSEILKFLKRG